MSQQKVIDLFINNKRYQQLGTQYANEYNMSITINTRIILSDPKERLKSISNCINQRTLREIMNGENNQFQIVING